MLLFRLMASYFFLRGQEKVTKKKAAPPSPNSPKSESAVRVAQKPGSHLNPYLAEFDFRYNNRAALGVNDQERADNLLRGVTGKRLTYETIR